MMECHQQSGCHGLCKPSKRVRCRPQGGGEGHTSPQSAYTSECSVSSELLRGVGVPRDPGAAGGVEGLTFPPPFGGGGHAGEVRDPRLGGASGGVTAAVAELPGGAVCCPNDEGTVPFPMWWREGRDTGRVGKGAALPDGRLVDLVVDRCNVRNDALSGELTDWVPCPNWRRLCCGLPGFKPLPNWEWDCVPRSCVARLPGPGRGKTACGDDIGPSEGGEEGPRVTDEGSGRPSFGGVLLRFRG